MHHFLHLVALRIVMVQLDCISCFESSDMVTRVNMPCGTWMLVIVKFSKRKPGGGLIRIYIARTGRYDIYLEIYIISLLH